jgi:hypothetical protein
MSSQLAVPAANQREVADPYSARAVEKMMTGDLRMVSDFERRWPMIFACHEIVEINNQGVITDPPDVSGFDFILQEGALGSLGAPVRVSSVAKKSHDPVPGPVCYDCPGSVNASA